MMRVSESAPGKIILFGEHAVVYGQPALAIPVTAVHSTAVLEESGRGEGIVIHAVDLKRTYRLRDAPDTDPIAFVVRLTLSALAINEPDASLTICSTIPIASGLGSGASVSAAVCKALMVFTGTAVDAKVVSEIVFEVEKIYHGTPSGIDNSVICYNIPIYFVKGTPPTTLAVGKPFQLIIADTGIASPTKMAVAAVREQYDQHRISVGKVISEIGKVAVEAAKAIKVGAISDIGSLMNRNQDLLRQLGVSSPELERLIAAAIGAGAIGAKLSGGGLGGNMIVLAPETTTRVMESLLAAGAKAVWKTQVT